MKKILSIILALSLVLALGTAALAGDTDFTRAADITYRGITIIVNGTKIVPQDANGNPVEPFIMDGTTYLPVRAVAGALGLDVDWDGATSSVLLTSGGKTVYGSGTALATNSTKHVDITYRDIAIVYNGDRIYATTADGEVVEPFIYDGTTYLPVRGVANALGLDVSWDGATSTVTLERATEEGEVSVVKSAKRSYTYEDGGKFDEVTTYEYDENGNVTLEKTTGGDADSTARYFYNADGGYEKIEYTGSYGTYTVYYEMSADGLTDRVYAVGDVEWENTIVYDKDWNVVSETDVTDGVTTKNLYTYNADGTELVVTYEDGVEVGRTVTTYTDDKTTRVTTGRGAGTGETVWGPYGIVSESYNYTDPDYMSYTVKYVYDDAGFEWKVTTTYANGDTQTTVYNRDQSFNVTSEVTTSNYGYSCTVTYEYMQITVRG